jgi:hypothetical protein
MWISRDRGRHPAIFRMLVGENARCRRQNGERLIHGNPSCAECVHCSNVIHAEKFHPTFTPAASL